MSTSDGIAGRFRGKVPSTIDAIGHWVQSLRASVKKSRAGIHWLDRVVVTPGQPGQIISHTIPLTVVFDFSSPAAVLCEVKLVNGDVVPLSPPHRHLAEVSSLVYNLILPLIDRDNRKFYEGIVRDDGWGLLARIKATEADLGNYLDLLEAKRDKLACGSYTDYITFKAAVLQLKLDWDCAIRAQTIASDEEWPVSKVKQLVVDQLSPLLGDELGVWVATPANANKTVAEMFTQADSIYKVKTRRIKTARSQASAHCAIVPPNFDNSNDVEDELAVDQAQFFARTNSQRAPRGSAPQQRQPPAKRARTDDAPPSWLAPMMTAMASTFAQVLVQSGVGRAPRNDGGRRQRGSPGNNDRRRDQYGNSRARGGGRNFGGARQFLAQQEHHVEFDLADDDQFFDDGDDFAQQ